MNRKKTFFTSLCIAGMLCCFFVTACTFSSSEKQRKSVFIIVDGVPADVIERVNTPFIDEIASFGGYARSHVGGDVGKITQTPTISAVGYNSLLTSTWVNKHNVWGNGIKNPNYNYWNVFRIAKNQNRELKTGIFSGWRDNRTKLIGEGLPAAGNIKMDYVLDGLDLDTVAYPREEKELQIFKVDETVSKAAAECIAKDAPDLTWVYLWYTDDAGHLTGTGDFFDEYLKKADIQVGRIWEAVKKRQQENNEDWMIVVTTDHGRDTTGGYHHGGQSDRERSSWIATNVKPNQYFKNETVSITDITPTICRYMSFTVPKSVEYEWEGVPFIGKVDVVYPTATREGNTITLKWKSYSDSPVDIYVSATNRFAQGGEDSYVKAGSTKAEAETFVYDCSGNPLEADYYKFSIRGKNTTATVWVK